MKLKVLTQSPLNVRQDYLEETVEDLKASIERDGLIGRIVLRQVAEGKYEVIAGGRRVEALKKLHGEDYELLELDYHVKEVSDYEALTLSISENVQRLAFTGLELATAAEKLQEFNPKIKEDEMAKILWQTKARVKRVLKVAKDRDILPEVVVEEMSKVDDDAPAFTDAHWDAVSKAGGGSGGLGSDRTRDICEYIVEHEVPPSKVPDVVDRFKDPEPEPENTEPETPVPDDTQIVYEHKGEIKLVEEDGKKVLVCSSKRDEETIDVSHYYEYLKYPDKFRCFIKFKLEVKPIED